MTKLSIPALAVATAVTAIVAATAMIAAAQAPVTATGNLVGQLDIGPFCAVQPVGGCPPPASTYTSREVTLKPQSGPAIDVPINSTGGFSAELAVGTYSLDLSNCSWTGCSSALPRSVVITQNETTFIQVSIDTGIR